MIILLHQKTKKKEYLNQKDIKMTKLCNFIE